jgi:hypothetical protein
MTRKTTELFESRRVNLRCLFLAQPTTLKAHPVRKRWGEFGVFKHGIGLEGTNDL